MTRLNDNGIHIEIPSSGLIQVATVTLSAAQLKSMSAGPIVIIPAPGENKHIEIMYGLACLQFGTTSFQTGGQGLMQWGVGTIRPDLGTPYVHPPVFVNFDTHDLFDNQVETLYTSFNSQGITSSGEEIPKIDNRAYGVGQVFNGNDPQPDLTAGDGNLTVILLYIVVSLG